MLAEYISANAQLKKENIQLKKVNNNQEQENTHLKSEEVKGEQVDSIKEEPTPDKGLKQFVCVRYA